jgi:hypothetical protein
MLSREQAITRLHEYKVPFDEAEWQRPTDRKPGEFGVFAIIIRIIGGLFIFSMVLVAIVGFIALIGLEGSWKHATGFIGIVATLFAGWKFRTSYRTLEKQYSFTGLLLLSILLVGKACLLVALFGWFAGDDFFRSSNLLIALIFAAITGASLVYYRMYLEAFLAVIVAAFLLNGAIAIELSQLLVDRKTLQSLWVSGKEIPSSIIGPWQFVQSVMIGLPLLIVGILVKIQNKRYLSSVYMYALLALVGYYLYPSSRMSLWLMNAQNLGLQINWGISLIVFISVAALYGHLVPNWRAQNPMQNIILLITIAILALLGMNGVLFALALMAWGHVRHDRVLWVVGLLYLPAYLIAYYYALDMSLLLKSYLLLASGAVVLAARYAFPLFVGPKKEQDHA